MMPYNYSRVEIKEQSMETDRIVLYTDSDGSLKGLPKFPPNKKVEAFFRVIGTQEFIAVVSFRNCI
jgi:hypothetical protein